MNLVVWEKENGFKAKYVAEQLRVSPPTYSRIKSGKQEPSLELVYTFLEKFGDTIADGNVLRLFEKF